MEINDEQWKGNFWGPEGVLADVHRRLENGESVAGLASIYYSASGNARARFRVANPLTWPYAFKSLVLLMRAMSASDKYDRSQARANPDVADVRATILSRIPGRRREAMELLETWLDQWDNKRFSVPVQPHTYFLMKGNYSLLLLREDRKSAYACDFFEKQVEKKFDVIEAIEPKQRCRIIRQRAKYFEKVGNHRMAEIMEGRAVHLAKANGLGDQVRKAQATYK